jgi:hypothetical protein
MLISAELYDRLQASYAFRVYVKIGTDILLSWEQKIRNYGVKFTRKLRLPLRFKYLNENVRRIPAKLNRLTLKFTLSMTRTN